MYLISVPRLTGETNEFRCFRSLKWTVQLPPSCFTGTTSFLAASRIQSKNVINNIATSSTHIYHYFHRGKSLEISFARYWILILKSAVLSRPENPNETKWPPMEISVRAAEFRTRFKLQEEKTLRFHFTLSLSNFLSRASATLHGSIARVSRPGLASANRSSPVESVKRCARKDEKCSRGFSIATRQPKRHRRTTKNIHFYTNVQFPRFCRSETFG